MKTFTAKQFSRTPGVVFDAARDDGKVIITHGPHNGYTLEHTGKVCKYTLKAGEAGITYYEKEKGPEWDATIQYTAGDRVIHNGVECVITETFSHPIPVID